ncbi:MAG: response regulator [Candidatus Theseobacter exili]|nr:response regulator [Candidatus Theseobacter exili]
MPRILIVDDESGMRNTLCKFLEKDSNYYVVTSDTAEDAIHKINEDTFDVVVSDIIMPKATGVNLLQIIKDGFPNIKVILITGSPTVDTAKAAVRFNAFDYLSKPVSRDEFCRVVNAAIRLKILEDENREYKELLEDLVNKRTRQIRQYSNRLHSIAEKTKDFPVSKSIEELASKILFALADDNNATGGSFYMRKADELHLIFSIDPGHQALVIKIPPPEKTVISKLYNQKKAFILEDINSNPDFKTSNWPGYTNGSIMAFPFFISDGKFNGAVVMHNKKRPPFDSQDIEMGNILVGHSFEAMKNMLLTLENLDTQKEVIVTLGEVLESRSKETANHVKRVSEYSRILAIKHGLNPEESNLLRMASPMHDIGKIGIPDAILNKPGKLNVAEFELIKTHTTIGYDILKFSKRKIFQTAAIIALEHHERWDGNGYPKGLYKNKISLAGRITAMADVFDALTHKRVYKEAWSIENTLEYFRTERGKHFDPELIDIFFNSINLFLEIIEEFPETGN